MALGVSLLTVRNTPAELRQSYGFDYDKLDSESPNKPTMQIIYSLCIYIYISIGDSDSLGKK
jgi:hypothetical protein